MKKMLFAALVACAAGVYAGCGTPDPVAEGAYVYEFKASLKVVEAKTAAASSTVCDATCYRVKATRTMKGLLIGCDSCAELYDGSTFWLTTSASKNTLVDTVDYTAAGLFFGSPVAAKATSAEMYMTIDGTDYYTADVSRDFELDLAGFGTQKAGVLRTISGNVVGTYAPAQCYTGSACEAGTASPATGFDPCTLDANEEDDDVAFGTWALKYNASLSKLAATNEGLVLTKYFGSRASYISDPE